MARSWRTSWAEGRGEATSDRVGDGQKARTSSKDFWPAWGHFPENRHLGKCVRVAPKLPRHAQRSTWPVTDANPLSDRARRRVALRPRALCINKPAQICLNQI